MGEELKISAYAVSLPGQEQNLDNVYVNGRYLTSGSAEDQTAINKVTHANFQVYGVCDGQVSGASAATEEVFPAAVAMQRLQRLQNAMAEDNKIDKDRIWDFLLDANSKMKEYKAAVSAEEVQASYAGLFLHGSRGLAVHLGDSRMYVVRGGRMLQITEDHLQSTDLYKFGILTQKQAEVHKSQSKLTAYLGMDDIYDAEETIFSKFFVFYPDDLFIICSDGITDYISNEDLERLIRGMKDVSPEEVAQAILAAVAPLSSDDKSLVVLRVEDTPDGNAAPVRGTESMPQKRNFEKEVPQKEPGQDTTRLSHINEGVAAEEQQVPGGAPAPAPQGPDQGYPDDYNEEDEEEDESIIDKLLSNPKRLIICLGAVLIIVVLIVAIFGHSSSSSSKTDTSSAAESSEEVSSEASDSTEESSVVVDESSDASESSEESSSPFDTDDSDSEESEDSEDSDESEDEDSDESEDSTSSGDGTTYEVQEGDILYNILTNEYGFYSDELANAVAEANGISVDELTVGQVLELPSLESMGLSE